MKKRCRHVERTLHLRIGCRAPRYGALKRCVRGVSDKMLIQQLKELQADGVVHRTDYKEIPPRVDYSLTPFGISLAQSLAPLCAWGEEHSASIAVLKSRRADGVALVAAE